VGLIDSDYQGQPMAKGLESRDVPFNDRVSMERIAQLMIVCSAVQRRRICRQRREGGYCGSTEST
jgi:dUTPase